MDFEKQVIGRSFEVPVVVDFWAPWCGPCRFLGPVITQLAEQANGAWELVKINTEEEKALASQFQIMSIPHVKLFSKGKAIAEFSGALPKGEIEKWLATYLPDKRKAELEQIIFSLQTDRIHGIEQLKKFSQQHPDLIEGRLALAEAIVFEDPALASNLVKGIKPFTPEANRAIQISTLIELAEFEIEDSLPIGSTLKKAKNHLKAQDFEATLEALIKAILIDKSFHNDLARRACIAIFQYLGEKDPISKKLRPHFNMALY